MFKLGLFISLFIVASPSKPIWDSKEHKYVPSYDIFLHNSYDLIEKNFYQYTYLNQPLDVLEHITLTNVLFYEIDATSMKLDNDKVTITYNVEEKKFEQIISSGSVQNNYLLNSKQIVCRISHCDVGLVFYHKTAKDMEIITKKLIDFEQVSYIAVTTQSNIFIFGRVDIKENHFPLILCPYKSWVNTYSKVTFKPKEESVLNLSYFLNKHILLPIHPRNFDSTMFFCGEIIYINGMKLKFGYEMSIEKDSKKLTYKNVNLIKDTLSCDTKTSENSFYHFSYNSYKDKESTMKYINMDNLKDTQVYHNSIIYMYSKKDKLFDVFEKDGVKNYGNLNENVYSYPNIKPTCAKFVTPLSASLKVYTKDDEKVMISENEKNPNIKLFYIENNMMNKKYDFDCRIVLNNIDTKVHLKDFYKNTFDTKLVSIDEYGNEKIIKSLEFKKDFEGFGKYSCKLSPKNSEKLDKDEVYIQPITFETFPSKYIEEIQNVTWQSKSTIVVDCSKQISNFAKLTDMHVMFSKTSKFQYSMTDDMKMFFEEDDILKFKHTDYLAKKSFNKLHYHCIYTTTSDNTFTVKRRGVVLEREIFLSNNEEKELNSTLQKTLIIIIIIIIAMIFIGFIIAIIFVKKSKKSKKLKKKLGLSSSVSGLSSNSSSSSSSSSSLSASESSSSSYVSKELPKALPSQVKKAKA